MYLTKMIWIQKIIWCIINLFFPKIYEHELKLNEIKNDLNELIIKIDSINNYINTSQNTLNDINNKINQLTYDITIIKNKIKYIDSEPSFSCIE